jgi:hypothetical protein
VYFIHFVKNTLHFLKNTIQYSYMMNDELKDDDGVK